MRLFNVSILLAVATQLLPAAVTVEQYHIHDFTFKAQASGNPFDVELSGEFTGPGGVRITVPGFYDGDNTWKIRFAPEKLRENIEACVRTVRSVRPSSVKGHFIESISVSATMSPGLRVNVL